MATGLAKNCSTSQIALSVVPRAHSPPIFGSSSAHNCSTGAIQSQLFAGTVLSVSTIDIELSIPRLSGRRATSKMPRSQRTPRYMCSLQTAVASSVLCGELEHTNRANLKSLERCSPSLIYTPRSRGWVGCDLWCSRPCVRASRWGKGRKNIASGPEDVGSHFTLARLQDGHFTRSTAPISGRYLSSSGSRME